MDVLNGGQSLEHLYNLFHETVNNASLLYSSNPRVASLLMCGAAFFFYYLRQVVKKPMLVCNENNFKQFLLQNCSQLQEKYWPTFWCFGTHGQTALANMIRGTIPDLKYKREILQMSDGGEVSLDWYEEPRMEKDRFTMQEESRPIAFFIPGLTGDSQTEYIKSLVPSAHALGYRPVAFNNRGRGGMKIKTPRLYCATYIDDMDEIMTHIRNLYPKARVVATGVSLGGIVLSHYLIRKGEKAKVDAVMLISICYDFISGCRSLEKQGLNFLLNRHLAKSLISVVESQREQLEELKEIDFDCVRKSTTLKEFDSHFTTKMWGYDSTTSYYEDAEVASKLHLIKKPTLCVNAADDMFQPLESIPFKQFQHKDSHCALVLTMRGGHIGFLEGFVPTLPFFSEKLSKQYLLALRDLDDLSTLVPS